MRAAQSDSIPDIVAIARDIDAKAKDHLAKQSTIDEINRRLSEQIDWILEHVPVKVGFDFEGIEDELIDDSGRFAIRDKHGFPTAFLRPHDPMFMDELLRKLRRMLVTSELTRFVKEFESRLSTIKHKKRIVANYEYDIQKTSLPLKFSRSGLTSEQIVRLKNAWESKVEEYEYDSELEDRIEKIVPVLRERLIPQIFHEELLHTVKKWLSTYLPTAQRWESSREKGAWLERITPTGPLDIINMTSREFWSEYTGEQENLETYGGQLTDIIWEMVSNKTNTIIAELLPTEHALHEDIFDFLVEYDEEFRDDFFGSLCTDLENWIMDIPVQELVLRLIQE